MTAHLRQTRSDAQTDALTAGMLASQPADRHRPMSWSEPDLAMHRRSPSSPAPCLQDGRASGQSKAALCRHLVQKP